ncbi:hypothetical protein BH20VER1_BH20VER1_15080 [soil metagenome]
MEATGERKIEIFAPFSAALDLTKRILFQPFDLSKWLVIGFAAFLAGLADGTRGFGFNFPGGGGGDFRGKSFSRDGTLFGEGIDWVLFGSIIALVAVIIIALVVLCIWLGSRGRFIFIDCIVRNRGAIAEPWHEYRREGNSLFLFTLLMGFVWLLLTALVALPLLLPFLRTGEFSFGTWQIFYLLMAGAVYVVLAVIWGLMVWFIPPVMYRQRCSALTALGRVVNLMGEYPAPFILFILFMIVLAIASFLVTCVVTCLTCCVAMIPYIGTVILLPLYIFFYAFTLLFLRQFGAEFDAWGNLPPLEEAVPAAAEQPPVQATSPAVEAPPLMEEPTPPPPLPGPQNPRGE